MRYAVLLESRAEHPKAGEFRVGEYRVLYTVDDDARAVRVYRIAHRREAYR